MGSDNKYRPLALVTGGSAGIGKGIATALSLDGFNLAITDLRDELPENIFNSPVRYFQQDLADIEASRRLIQTLYDEGNPPDCLVLNAGMPAVARGDILEIDPANFDRLMDVNLRGNFFLAAEWARLSLQAEGNHFKSLIFITSVSAELASTDRAEYCISKAALAMVAKLYSVRLAEAGIGVYDVRPGIIKTEMTAHVAPKYDPMIAQGVVPAKRWGETSDLGSVVLSLAKGLFPFSTGSVINVGGGLHIGRL